MKFLFILFVVMPVVEITLLIKVGQQIGALNTAGLVVLTAVIGSFMLRQQGLSTLFRAQERMNSGQIPLQEMLEGIFLAVGGTLLITPGFVTDLFGFLCLIPVTRAAVVRFAGRYIKVRPMGSMHQSPFGDGPGAGGFQQRDDDSPIEGEFQRDETPEMDPAKKIPKS